MERVGTAFKIEMHQTVANRPRGNGPAERSNQSILQRLRTDSIFVNKEWDVKNHEKDAQPEKIKRKIVFSDLRNPPISFTPLFGEVAKFRTLTKTEEQ